MKAINEAIPKSQDHHPNWKGGRTINTQGYVGIRIPGHVRSNSGYVPEHVLIAEKALGKPLPLGAIPHHVNEDKTDNRPGNLIICQDRAYHNLLHRRMRALRACGHANWMRCAYCKSYDDPANMYVRPNKFQGYHRQCENAYHKKQRNNNSKGRKYHG